MTTMKTGLKFKILAMIIIAIISTALILTYSTYGKLKQDIYQKNNDAFNTFADTFYSEKDILAKKYSMSLDILLENQKVIRAFKNRDRKLLKSLINDLYSKRLKHFYNIEQFQFHLSPATSFYRAHAPSRYGDDLSAFRKTVLLANKDKNLVTGLEVGRSGLGLRVVKPVWYKYDFIGTVELGGNIENLLTTPSSSTGLEYTVGIFTNSLQRSKFFYSDEGRYTYKGMYLYNYSSGKIKTLITTGRMDNENRLIKFEKRYYMVKNLPLKDFSSNHIGYILLSRDTTKEVLSMQRELLKQIAVISIFAVSAIAILTLSLVNLIFTPLEKITDHISSLKTESYIPSDPIVIKGNTEITMLADAFNILSEKLSDSFDKINKHMNEIQSINTSLENRVQRRTTQLEDTNTRLKNAMAEIQLANEAKSEFLASMSHEIRTPMNAVLGLSYLLMQTELSGKQYDYVSKIRSSANLLLEIINDILDFSKIEAGKLELENQPFNLKENLIKIASMIEISVNRKDIEMKLNIDSSIPDYLIGDQLRITQVLNNLAANAAKFTEQGNISISAELINHNDAYAKIKITVSDTGIGIPPDKIPILFDSFTQVKRKEQKRGGSGLGLSITKKILDAMNSEIMVKSVNRQGSEFTFYLTLEIAKDSDVEAVTKHDNRFNGKRVLVCEPTSESPNSCTSFFRENSADVLSVNNKESLTVQLKNNIDDMGSYMFDLLVIDISVTGIPPFYTIKELVNDNSSVIPPVILLTDSESLPSEIAELLNTQKTFTIHNSAVHEKLPLLSSEILSYGRGIKTETEGFKRSLASNSGLNVLLVDDNDINLQVITEFAEILGLNYNTARNGLEALKSVEENHYDIVFMDLIMPDMDGLTAAKNMRDNTKHKSTAIYALSASSMDEEIEKCRVAGMDGHIAKPVKLSDITMAINDYKDKMGQNIHKELILPKADNHLDVDYAVSNLNNNKQLYMNLLIKFHSEYADTRKECEKILKENDNIKARAFFHTLKGAARTLGASKLEKFTENLEKAAADNLSLKKTDDLKNMYSEIEILTSKIEIFIKDQKN